MLNPIRLNKGTPIPLPVYHIRPFQSTDMFTVVKIASDTLTEQYTPNLFNYFFETFPETFLVAEYHHKIVGFIVGVTMTKDIARILMLSVKPEYRRKQIGTKLLNTILTIFQNKNVKTISLEVRDDNKDAISFYRKHGFTIAETIENFYQNNETAYIMLRELQHY